jgi:hypothetical protein
MKKNLVGMLGLAMLALFVGYVVAAPGACAAGSESKGSDMKDMKCTVTGKVEVKTEKVDGKDVKVPYVKVAEVKGEDGKAMENMKGMDLKVVGPKAVDAEKLAGKEVEVKGVVKGGKEIAADSVAEKAAPKGSASKGSSSK